MKPLRSSFLPPIVLCLLLITGALVAALTVGDYGVSWDEGVQGTYGELVLKYFRSGGQEQEANTFSNLRFYGPGFELLSAWLSEYWPERGYIVRHLLSALAALATGPALYLIGRRLGSAWIGVVAALALLLMPRFYGHAFINSKDIPFACTFTWSIALLIELLEARSRQWWLAAALGVAAGLMLCVRPGGLPLFIAIAAPAALWYLRFVPKESRLPIGRTVAQLGAALAIAWVVMVLPWPYAHENPIVNPIRAMLEAAKFTVAYPVLFAGEVRDSNQLPLTYLPQYLLITTPLPVLILAAAGLALRLRRLLDQPRSSGPAMVILLWLATPLLLYLIQRPNVYDGLRHFLFLLPVLALWAGVGVIDLVRALPRARLQMAAGALALLALLAPLPALIRLHPYQMTYFNQLVGGLAGASGLYETDYWITSYREAIEWIDAQAAQQPDRTFGVLVAAPKNALATVRPFKAANVRVALTLNLPAGEQVPEQFDFYIGMSRYGMSERYPLSPVVHTIGRDGAIFTVIRRR